MDETSAPGRRRWRDHDPTPSRPRPLRRLFAGGPRATIGTALGILLAGTVAVAAVALVILPKLTGSVPLAVLTGSMAPTYPPGSVVMVRPTPVDELRVGDAITYQLRPGDPTVVTHRIVGVTAGPDGRAFITQGDANRTPDAAPVVPDQVQGRVWYSVPYVGHVSTWLAGPTGSLWVRRAGVALIVYGALAVTLTIATRWRRARTSQPRQDETGHPGGP